MALIGSGKPLLYVEGTAVQTGGSGNSRTVKITAKFKCDGNTNTAYHSWYGYPCNWRARVHNSYGSYAAIKGTETWYSSQGLRTFEQTLTVDVGTTAATNITVGIYTNHPSYSSWNGQYTWTLGVGATNVAPSLSGTITADSTTSNKTIPENQGSIALSCPAASDSNLSGYRFAVSVNGGGYTEIYKGANRTYTHSPGVGEGTSYKYSCYAYDAMNATSSTIYSPTITKNVFTPDTLTSSSTIGFNTSNYNLSFAYSGAKNTNGSTSFTRTLSTDKSNVPVYNSTITATPFNVAVYVDGQTVPTGPYVKLTEIKNAFSGSSYAGTLNFILTIKNAYGTSKTSTKSIAVNLQTPPNSASGVAVSTTASESTCYVTAITGNNFFIPDGGTKSTIRVKWNAGSGKLGEAISGYEVFVSYGGGAYSSLGSTTALYYNHVLPKQTSSQTVSYKVRTKVAYGLYTDSTVSSSQTLHYYNAPYVTRGALTRGATTAEANFVVDANTSISKSTIKSIVSWKLYNKANMSAVLQQSSTATTSNMGSNLKISLSGLADSTQYALVVTYKDNTIYSADKDETIDIGANSPLFFVNQYGVGVNGVKASSQYSLLVKGTVNADNIAVGGNNVYHTGRKPTAADIGALSTSGKAADASKVTTSNSGGFYEGNGDAANSTTSNIQIKSWYGIGFAPSISGQATPQNQNALWMNVRSGDMGMRGALTASGTVLSRDTLRFNNNSVWKSIDLTRTDGTKTGTARFGIGVNADGPSPTIEYKAGPNVTDANEMRLDLCSTSMRLSSTGSQPSCWIGIYSGSTRQGYIGRGSNNDNIFRVYSETGDLILSTNYRIQAGGHFHATTDNLFYLGLSNPAGRWKQLVAATTAIATSDYRLKENIRPVLKDSKEGFSLSKYGLKPYSVLEPEQDFATEIDYYNFVKDELQLYGFDYRMEKASAQGLTENQIDDCRKASRSIGFMAHDYDIENNKVAREFLFESEDGILNWNTGNYTNVLAAALKVALNKIDDLENRVKSLEKKRPHGLN